jgi:hypothetical protein
MQNKKTNHLISKHENSFEGQLPITEIEQILKTRAK